jgi:hypothetical protein
MLSNWKGVYMCKSMIFCLWEVHKGTSSMHREMEIPLKKVAWGEEIFFIPLMCEVRGVYEMAKIHYDS